MSKVKSTEATVVEVKDVEVVEDANVDTVAESNSWNFEPAIEHMSNYMALTIDPKLYKSLTPLDHKGIRQHFTLNELQCELSFILRDALGNMFYRHGKSHAIKRFALNEVPMMSFHAKAKARKTQAEKADDGLDALRKTMGDEAFEAFIQSQLAKVKK